MSGGALLCLALILSGCGGTASTGAPDGSGAAGGSASPSEPAEAVGSIAVGTPSSAALDEALGAFADSYSFVAEITVGGEVATVAGGRRVGDGAEFTVAATGTRVTYRTIGTDAWVKREGADWTAVDGTKTDADPLAALRTPTSVEEGRPVEGAVSLVATYPATALGLTGDGDLPVAIVIHDDGTVEATYALDTAAGPATSHTTFSPVTDPTPIVAPG